MNLKPEERIIVALDVGTAEEARRYLELLKGGPIWGVKVGLQLCTAIGAPAAVAMVKEYGLRVMLDLKFADIPNTMAGAARAAASLGVEMFTIHTSVGIDSIKAVIKNCGQSKVLGVTVLTSIDDSECNKIFGTTVEFAVMNFAHYRISDEQVHGVVCSPKELIMVRNYVDTSRVKSVVPGIRPVWAVAADQKRIMTPGEAITAGATHLVIGRPITNPPTGMPTSVAMDLILKEIIGAGA